ncbi:MAG: DUF177 domain-containing protein [Alphaproteobacteria bacterium]|nr:DUF177 domain-containing protein [Alphaproteobacteria bacterium]MCD8571278.1 DUF177 domain-containing protein [Alphaproteobacteria bacterium]
MNIPHTLPEWSYLVEEDRAGTDVTDLKLSPSAEEVEALCKRLNLLSLDNMRAHITLERQSGGMVVHVKGRFTADITQACVVSLEPVASHLDEKFEGWFANSEQAVMLNKARRDRQNADGEAPMLEEKDDPEPIVNGHIDLGELITQYLSLAIDPYPHAPGMGSGDEDDAVVYGDSNPGADIRRNPFAALKNWKGGGDKD